MDILPGRKHRRARRRAAGFAAIVLVAGAAGVGQTLAAVSGNIAPKAIEVDAPNTANLYPGGASVGCSTANFAGGATDWVADCSANTDPQLLENSVATGIRPGVTGKAGGTGHWNGVRIVDGFGGDDQDIFLTGGKENDVSTWNIGPGSIGSSKYDGTQAYLANNLSDLFFGMERRGNNGTTAFDFEFNQLAPAGGTGSYIPNRSLNDVLLTFEMSGSGSSGSAAAFYYTWNGTAYEPKPLPSGTVASINDSTTTPAAPWGHVSSTGSWTGGNLQRFEFAEAKVPLSALPGVNNCGGRAFTQVRTRSSSTSTSDLKDTTKIFEFLFGSPEAQAQLSTDCQQQITYGSAGSQDASGGSLLSYNWDITVSPTTATLAGGGVSAVPGQPGKYTSTAPNGTAGVTLPAGVDSAQVTVNNTASSGGGACSDSSGNKTVTVYRALGATATLTPQCNNVFTYASTVTGGRAPYTYAWTFQKNSLASGAGTWSNVPGGISSTPSGTFTAPSAGAYRALLTVQDTPGAASSDPDVTPKPQCTATTTSNTINVYDAVGGTVGLTPDCDSTFTYAAAGSGGNGPYSYAFVLEKQTAAATATQPATWATAKTFGDCLQTKCASTSGTLDINSLDTDVTTPGGPGIYRLKVTITDSQGIVCTANLTSAPVEVLDALAATAQKTSADATAQSVLLTGSSATGAALQWERKVAGQWVAIPNQNAATLTYSSFEADDVPETEQIQLTSGDAAGNYEALLYVVELRLKATRTLNGAACDAFSPAVVVKKLSAVDP